MYGLTQLETGITPDRLGVLISYSWMVSEKKGAFVEFGVMKGGSLDLLSALHPDRYFFGIDSFKGLPKPGANDIHHNEGDFALSDEEYLNIVTYFAQRKVLIVKGFSPGVFKFADAPVAFLHCDVDMESSVNDALTFFFPRMVKGGVMIFDDYGFLSTPGAKKAIDEWKGECEYRGEIIFNNGVKTGQYLIVK